MSLPRTIKTTYYGPGRGKNKPEVKTTLGRNREEIGPNIMRHMTRNDYGAVVAEAYDIETGELLLVATYFIGEAFKVTFEPDVSNPVCVSVPIRRRK
jgi:hypothetical protein